MIPQKYIYCLIISTILIGSLVADEGVSQPLEDAPVEAHNDAPPEEAITEPTEPPTVENTTVVESNLTAEPSSKNITQKHANCLLNQGSAQVQLVNDTELVQLLQANPNITSKDTPANCLCVLFYSKHCTFSSLAAPHFNALPRAFPDLRMVAINAIMYHMFNTQNGIVGVPSLLLLHNGKIIDKFNESDYTLEQFSRFITKNTGIAAAEKSFVISADFAGPVASSPTKETDVLLVASWCFILFCVMYYFSRSNCWRWMVEFVQHNWRESAAQAQHEHVD